MATQHFKRNLLNLSREGKTHLWFVSSCHLRDKNVWHLQPLSSIWRPLAFLPVTLSVRADTYWRLWQMMAEQHLMNENLSWTLDITIFNHLLDREFIIGHFFLCHHSNCPHSASIWFHIYNRTVLNRSLQIQLNNQTEIYCLCQYHFILYSSSNPHMGINIIK